MDAMTNLESDGMHLFQDLAGAFGVEALCSAVLVHEIGWTRISWQCFESHERTTRPERVFSFSKREDERWSS